MLSRAYCSQSRGQFVKALNIDQPWAELIIRGRKKIELRNKRTSYRGLIVVRATKTVLIEYCKKYSLDPDKLPTGKIVGTVEIVNVIDFTQKLWEDLRNEHLSDAPQPGNLKGWKLNNPKCLQSPIPYPRTLPGIFNLPEETAEKIRKAEKIEG
jgi:hypothetical protein